MKEFAKIDIYFAFLAFLCTNNTCSKLDIQVKDHGSGLVFHEQFIHDYSLCGIFVESMAYKILKKRALEFRDVEYLPVPWFDLSQSKKYNSEAIHKYVDSFKQLHLNNAFTVCLCLKSSGIDDYVLDVLDSIGVKCIFTPDVSVTTTHYKNIHFEPLPHYAIKQVKPAQIKDILYSFVGTPKSHPIRKKLFAIDHPKDTVLIALEKYGHTVPKGIYEDILARSRFSLCPRGINVGSVRFWESLCAGAIPILISDEQILPYGFDWSSCIIRVKESDIQNIPDIVLNIPLQTEESMRLACYKAYQEFSGQNFISPIIRYYALHCPENQSIPTEVRT
jgi:hypothetical protein